MKKDQTNEEIILSYWKDPTIDTSKLSEEVLSLIILELEKTIQSLERDITKTSNRIKRHKEQILTLSRR